MNGNYNFKVGFIIPSNRPDQLSKFLRTKALLNKINSISKFCLVYQDPVNGPDYDFGAFKKIDEFDPTPPLPMLQLRRHGLDLTEDCEYICCLDDDHEFVEESDEYYMECVEFMDNNADIGVVGLKSGLDTGWIRNPKDGLFQNGTGGMFYRNIGKDKMFPKECHDFVGVLSEPLMAYNIINEGFNCAKRFGCKNKRLKGDPDKFVNMETNNITYSEQVANKNVQGYLRDKFNDPEWRYSSKMYPKTIADKLGIKQ